MVIAHRTPLDQPAMAAITLSPHGGGIAAVSRLVHQVLSGASMRPVPCYRLSNDDRQFESSTGDRARFGLQLAAAQAFGRCGWVFYTHLNLAAVQRFVPAAVARPYAVFLYDVEAWTPLQPAMRRVLAGAFLRLACSRHTATRVLEANPGCGAIVVCPLALQPETDIASVGRPAPDRPHSVVIVGRMTATDRYKGHDQLIEAWPAVLARVPSARLVCVGEGDDVPRLRARAVDTGVGAAIDFTGFVDDGARARIYANAAVLAMPSRREGFGLVYVEAMAAGLPCIGSVHDAASEVIVDGETGFLVDQDDRAALVDRLVRLLTDEALRQRMGEAGRARYRALFTYESFRDRLVRHIEAAMPAGRVGVGGRRGARGTA